MQPQADGQAKDAKLRPLCSFLLLQMRLHVHARLGHRKTIGDHHRMTVWAVSSLIWIRLAVAPGWRQRRKMRSRKSEGAPEGPFTCYQPR